MRWHTVATSTVTADAHYTLTAYSYIDYKILDHLTFSSFRIQKLSHPFIASNYFHIFKNFGLISPKSSHKCFILSKAPTPVLFSTETVSSCICAILHAQPKKDVYSEVIDLPEGFEAVEKLIKTFQSSITTNLCSTTIFPKKLACIENTNEGAQVREMFSESDSRTKIVWYWGIYPL